jgi:hypothetical protein
MRRVVYLWFNDPYDRSRFELMESQLGIDFSYRPDVKMKPPLADRYYLIGLVLPTLLILYFLVFAERILSRPEGFAVQWWMQQVMDSTAGAAKTVRAYAKAGVSKAGTNYASLAFAIFVFAVVFNSWPEPVNSPG